MIEATADGRISVASGWLRALASVIPQHGIIIFSQPGVRLMAMLLWDHGHPGIKIVTKDDASGGVFFAAVHAALNDIRGQPIGRGLLKTISAKCLMSGKSVFISYFMVSLAGPSGEATEAYSYQKADSEGRVFIMPGAGQSASVSWDPTDPGPPYAPRPAFIGLAHELIHALHILHGLQVYDTNSANGLAINEATVVGLGIFAGEPFTENAIRGENGVAARSNYYKDGADYATNDFVTGATPLPVYANSSGRP